MVAEPIVTGMLGLVSIVYAVPSGQFTVIAKFLYTDTLLSIRPSCNDEGTAKVQVTIVAKVPENAMVPDDVAAETGLSGVRNSKNIEANANFISFIWLFISKIHRMTAVIRVGRCARLAI